MTTPPPSPNDDDADALYWLTMARRILSGEIAPHEARHLIDGAPRTVGFTCLEDVAPSPGL